MRLFSKNQSKPYSLKPFLGLLCLTLFLMSFTLLGWESSNTKDSENSIVEEKVQIKMEKGIDEFTLFIADNSIYTKAKNEKNSLWLDDVQLPLNSKHPVNYTELMGMLELNEGTEYRVYSKEFLDKNNNGKLKAKNENDVVYRFHTKGGTHFTTEFNSLKDTVSENFGALERDEKPNNTLGSNQLSISEPVKSIDEDDGKINKLKQKGISSTDSTRNVLYGSIKGVTTIGTVKKVGDKKISNVFTLNGGVATKRYVGNANPGIIDLNAKNNLAYTNFQYKLAQVNEKQIGNKIKIGSVKNSYATVLQNDSVLVVLNGKIIGKGTASLPDLDVNLIQSLNVLKGEKAVEKYGERGASGVIEITTNNDFTEKDEEELFNSFNLTDKEGKTETIKISSYSENPPLFFVDGVPSQPSYFKNIKPNDIKKIEVLKGEKATKKYGDKAKYGVVEIYTKSGREY